MWVLEARYKAEKVWYSFIWEKAKEDPNVIDYNINEEITKDTSAVFNANNDTTTGMATVIPWVNAPKLIAKTSIYWIDFNAWFKWWVQFRYLAATSTTIPIWEEVSVWVDRMTEERDERWPYDFKYMQWKWIVIPTNWTYELKCLLDWAWTGWSAYFDATLDTFVWGVLAHTSASTTWWTTETFNINAYKWQWITFRVNYDNRSTDTKYAQYILRATLTKL